MRKKEKNNQTAKKPSRNISTRTNSVFSGSLLGKSPIDHKKIPEKKQTCILKKELGDVLKKSLSLIDTPTTDIIIEKPINEYDRLNALSRMPEVQKALNEIENEKDKNRRNGLMVEFSGKYKEPPNVFKNIRKRKSYDPDAVRALCNFEMDSTKSLSRYRDGEHLIIAVNLTKKNQDIFNELKWIIKQARRDYCIPKDSTKDKNPMLDIWEIYDLRTKGIKSSVVTARIFRKHSEQNERQVKRYYNKAKRIYESVKASIDNRDDK